MRWPWSTPSRRPETCAAPPPSPARPQASRLDGLAPAAERIRLATGDDVDVLTRRHQSLVGSLYEWADHLGDGSHADSDLALVAEVGGHVVAHVGVGPFVVSQSQVIQTDSQVDPRRPWWKIHALAVDPAFQNRGVGTRLLQQVMDRIPATQVGVFGSVALANTRAHAWYRARGFYLANPMALPNSQERSARTALVQAPPQEVFFRGFTQNVRDHLAGKGHPRSEARLAREIYDADLRRRRRLDPARGDTGYRQYASRIAARPGPYCPHATLGPRSYQVSGWDPQLIWVCGGCQLEHLSAIAGWDAADHCDGCHRTRPDVVLSWAAVDEAMVFASAGLCGTCRAGQTLQQQ